MNVERRKIFFISYTQKDKDKIKDITDILKLADYKVIKQEWAFNEGEDFAENIEKSLKNNNADYFIAVLSENYVDLLKGQEEVSFAFRKYTKNKNPLLILIKNEDIEFDELKDLEINCVNLHKFDNFNDKQSVLTNYITGKKDFFISYNYNDKDWALFINTILIDKGYTTIIQEEDFAAGGNFVLNMHEALKTSARFVAVLSFDYLASMYCQAEWANFFTKDPNGEKALFIPVRITDVKPDGLLSAIVYINLYGLDKVEAATELLKKLSLGKARNIPGFPGTKRTRLPGEIPLNNLPHARNPYFTGRSDNLDLIYKNFQSGDVVSLVQSLNGMGGVGKTSLALEYAYAHSHEYETIWWVNAGNPIDALADYKELALKKKIISENANKNDIIEAMKYWFNNNENWLFIYDNADAEDFKDWFEPYLPQSRKGHVLITTRSSFYPKSKSIDIIVFTENEALAFLKKRIDRSGEDYSEQSAKELVKVLGYFPLALEQAAAYIIEVPGVSYQDYINQYKKKE